MNQTATLRDPMLAFRYALFAGLAGAANLLTQTCVMRLAPVYALELSVLMGTGAGFAVKYVLDKLWIFNDAYDGHIRELRKVVFYGFFSVMTTLVFWGSEYGFWYVGQTSVAKYTGAVLGLIVGNTIKFFLDRAYVFKAGAT